MNPQKKALHALLRTNLSAFIMKTFHTVDGSQEYVPNWHIDLIADKLTRCMKGEIKRLIINLPPRSLKSVCAGVAFPAWVLGHDPGKRIITVSYSDELSGKHARDCRSLMESGWYREVFPKTRINPRKNTEIEFETTKNGYRLATSIGGTLTGRGGNLIIIDDPIKPQEALSDVKRNNVNQWFMNTLYSRMDNKNTDCIIILMQRVHLDDLCGFVQEKEEWEVLNLPAIAEKDEEYTLLDGCKILRKAGEALNPQLESLDILNNLKNTIGEYNFSAQYQQRPIPAEGNVVRWEWFNFYEGKIPYVTNEWGEAYEGTKLQSWDTAMTDGTNSDYSAGMTFEYYDDKYYLLDIHRGKWAFAELLEEIVLYHQRFMPRFLVIEGKGIGTSLCQQLRREYYINAEEYVPKEGKAERAVSVSPAMKLGMLHVNKSIPILDEFYKEIVTFPFGRHDDMVDALVQGLIALENFRYLSNLPRSF